MAKQGGRNTREEILELSIPLFAISGFDGVSMRDVATAVGVSPAALYHHFSDKEQLYLGAIGYAFEQKLEPMRALLEGGGNPWERLKAFVTRLANLLADEPDFLHLMQWAMLDGDERRQRSLLDHVFRSMFTELIKLVGQISPGRDPHLLGFSVIGLVFNLFETQRIRRFLPGYQAQNETPDAIAGHVVGLLRDCLGMDMVAQ